VRWCAPRSSEQGPRIKDIAKGKGATDGGAALSGRKLPIGFSGWRGAPSILEPLNEAEISPCGRDSASLCPIVTPDAQASICRAQGVQLTSQRVIPYRMKGGNTTA